MSNLLAKRWLIGIAVFFLMTAAAFAGVNVSSPTPGSTTGSPVRFVASATGSGPISAMSIYVDGNKLYGGSAASVNTSVAMSTGPHSISIQAWDVYGNLYKSAYGITVSNSPSTSPTPTGSAPGNATTFYNIEAMGGWGNCTVCAGIGASGPAASYWMQQNVSSPSLNGRSTQFHIAGSTPFSDVIWWKELTPSGVVHFQYDADFYLTAPQYAFALEFDVNQTANSRRFVYGTQCGVNYDHQWDVWDTAGNRWRPTGVPCSVPSAYQWHHLTWEFYRDSNYIHFVAVTVDGVKHYVNAAYASIGWGGGPEVNVAFQMDGDSSMHAYGTWLNNVTLRYW